MKTGFITTMLLLFAAGMAQAQDNQAKIDGNPNVNTIVVNTTGDVTIYQGDKFAVKWNDETVHYNMNFELKDSVAYLSGTDDFEVTMPMLKYLEVNSCGDVVARDEIVAKNISICSNGSGDVDLNLICSNIYLRNNGSGDVTLRGSANALMVETKGKGTNNAVKLKHSVSIINGYGQKNDELAVLRVGGEGTVNQYNPNSEGWLYETRQFAEFMDARLSWTCQRCAAFTFECVGNEWALKGVENIPQEPENARLVRSAAPFFNQEQNRNRGVAESEDLTNVTENDTLKYAREQLDEDLGNLVKDITQGIVKGSREEWSEEQWEAWGDSLEMRAKEYERGMRKYGKEMEEKANKMENSANVQKNYSSIEDEDYWFMPKWEGTMGLGLNMLLTPSMNQDFGEEYMFLEQNPLKSWYVEFNCLDAGLAFDKKQKSGIFTGVGFSVNRFFFKNPIALVDNSDSLSAIWIDESQYEVKKSRLGTMYLNVPVMFEFNPARKFSVQIGVIGGLRLFAINKVYYKYKDVEQLVPDSKIKNRGFSERDFGRYCTNLFSLKGSLRFYYGDVVGLFANYDFVPLFDKNKGPEVCPLSIGFIFNL